MTGHVGTQRGQNPSFRGKPKNSSFLQEPSQMRQPRPFDQDKDFTPFTKSASMMASQT